MKSDFATKVKDILDRYQIVRNSCRKDFISRYIESLLQCRHVHFHRIAQYLNDGVKLKSNQKRIEDFFRDVELDYTEYSRLILSLLPKEGKLRLCLDRTEWDFGKFRVNILMATISIDGLCLPFWFELLDNNSGNSSTADRIGLVEKVLGLLTPKRIGMLVMDREFIGKRWLGYLSENKINFVVRVPKHHTLHIQHQGVLKACKVENLAKNGQRSFANCVVDNVVGNAYLGKDNHKKLLFVFGNVSSPSLLPKLYKKRWCIEAFFQNIKKRGFNIEDSHLKCIHKMRKLVALVGLAYAFCAYIGNKLDQLNKIPTKNHGYKANSISRVGLDYLLQAIIKHKLEPIFILFNQILI